MKIKLFKAKSLIALYFLINIILFPTAVICDCSLTYNNIRSGTQDLCICTGGGGGKTPTGGYTVWSPYSTGNTPSTDPTGNTLCEGCGTNCYYMFPCELKQFCDDPGNTKIPECASVANVSPVCSNTIENNKRAPIQLRKNIKSKSRK